MTPRHRITFAMLAIVLAAGSAGAQVVASVNGEDITRSEFGLALVRSLGRAALDSYVDRELIEQEARRRGISVSAEEVRERMELEVRMRTRAVARNSRMGPKEFQQTARNYGWDMEQVRREIEEGISETRVRYQLLTEKILEPSIDLSERALRDYFTRTRGRRYAAAHVAVSERQRAEELLRRLKEDLSLWDAAVVQYSLDRASVPHRGRIGPVPAGSELGRVLAGMKQGELTLYQGPERWHVLRYLTEVPPEPVEFEKIRDRLRAEFLATRAGQMQYGLLADLSRDATVVTNLASEPSARRILGEDVAAWVGGQPVKIGELAEALIDQFGPAMLESYVERTLVLQEAEERGVSVSEREMEERLDAIADQLFARQAEQRGMTTGELRQFLADAGVPLADFRDRLLRELVSREDVRATLLAEKMVAGGVEVTEADLQQAHREYYGDRYTVKEMTTDSATEARRLTEALEAGAGFDLLLQAEARRPGAWLQGTRALTVTSSHPYYTYVKGVGEGETTGVFRYDGLYRIIKVVEHHPATEKPPLESVRDEVEREVRMQKMRERIRAFLLKLKAEADIQVELE